MLEPTLEITKVGDQFKGRYVSGQQLDMTATNLKVENNHLTFSIAGEVNGTKLKGDYKGRSYGDKIKGTIKYELGDRSGELEFTGTNTGPMNMGGQSVPATQKKITGHGDYFARIRDGKIVEFRTHPDVAGLMMQMGMMPTMH